MKSRKKNKRKAPKRARAKRRRKPETPEEFEAKNRQLLQSLQAPEETKQPNPAEFADVLAAGIGGQRGWKVLGRGIKRPVRSGRKAKKTEIFREAEKLHDEGFSYPQIAKRLTLDAFKEDPRKAGEAIRQGVLRLRERPSTSISDCITVEQDPNADSPKPAV